MKRIFSTIFIGLFIFFSSTANFSNDAKINSNKQPVLIELFTAQGCPSCPAAEKMLAELENEQPFADAELITLAFHVDYWDGVGWKDEFASTLFTNRQKVYDRKFRTGKIYTPQMVVDGDIEFIGSKKDKAEKAVQKTLKIPKAKIELTVQDEKLKIKISNLPKHDDATLYLAYAEDGIETRVKGGENKGKDLKNVSLVRNLNGLVRIMPDENSFETETTLQIQKDWKRENIKLVVFLQENGSRNVIGVNSIKLPIEKKS